MTRWRDRPCTCGHPRSFHGHIAGQSYCDAMRCGCPIFDAVWAARLWARIHRAFAKPL